jgi:hypothetical protein
LITSMETVNVARRREARAMHLINGNRAAKPPSAETMAQALTAWGSCLRILHTFVVTLTPEAITAADDLVAEEDDPTEIIEELLKAVGTFGMGFSSPEFDWLIDQFRKCGFRMLSVISGGDPLVLRSLVDAALSGDGGINQIGFTTFTDNPETNRHIEAALARTIVLGITPSIFHLLPAAVLSAVALGVADETRLGRIAQRVRQNAFVV